jgi:uncharacterized coiled-coil DUF342 family protein
MLDLTKANLSRLTSNDTLKQRANELKAEIEELEAQRQQKADMLAQTEVKIAELQRANHRLKILRPFAALLTADQTSDLGDPTLRLLQLLSSRLQDLSLQVKSDEASHEALEQEVARKAQHRKELEAELRTIRPYDTLIHNFLKVMITPKLKAQAVSTSPDKKRYAVKPRP